MVEIDFGEVVSTVLSEMDGTESELEWNERENVWLAKEHYKRNLVHALRATFDEVEEREKAHLEREATREKRAEDRLKKALLELMKNPEFVASIRGGE